MDETKDLSQQAKMINNINGDIILSDWEKAKIFKKLLSLVSSASNSSSQKELLKIKKKLNLETSNQNIFIYKDLDSVLGRKNIYMTINDSELKKLLPNSSFEHQGILNWLGIRKISQKDNTNFNTNFNSNFNSNTNYNSFNLNL